MKNILVHAWALYKWNERYYLPFMHWVYLKKMRDTFSRVVIIAPVVTASEKEIDTLSEVHIGEGLEVRELPGRIGYAASIPLFFHYCTALWHYRKVDVCYARFPVPFAWLIRLLGVGRYKIIHFVGDPVGTVRENPAERIFKKKVLANIFKLEEYLVLWAAKKADDVVINGVTFSDKLTSRHIGCRSLISSTLEKEDFGVLGDIVTSPPAIMYLGYLRSGKRVDVLINALAILLRKYPEAHLHLVGDGDKRQELEFLAREIGVSESLTFHGHIDDRKYIKRLASKCTFFWFSSVSEGSPRVIVESMAWGLPVISTSVGSLPHFFRDNHDILFVSKLSPEAFVERSIELLDSPEKLAALRDAGRIKVKDLTVDRFLEDLFSRALSS